MTLLSIIYATWITAAVGWCVVALGLRIRSYARTPAPLKIPTTPAPRTRAGVVGRLVRETVLFESLFKSNKWTWLFGWCFHAALLLALLRHLRYVQQPLWEPLVWIQPLGAYGGFLMVFGLTGLWARRFVVDRVRYVSTVSDHLWLALLLAIALSGLAMRFSIHTDIVAVKNFALGLVRLHWQPLPTDPLLLGHLAGASLLFLLAPISKLLHAPGLYFSPSRNQADDAREVRHVTAWAASTDPK